MEGHWNIRNLDGNESQENAAATPTEVESSGAEKPTEERHKIGNNRQQANLDAALALAKAGLPVFPAAITYNPASTSWRKQPCISDWQNKATNDAALIQEWWTQFPDAAPAIALGKAKMLVIDQDQHGGPDGVANFAKLIEGSDLTIGPIVKTAGGGKHLFFRQPETGEPLGNGRGNLPEGIDVRGSGGFVIAPGAVRPDGAVYMPDADSPDLAEAFSSVSIPVLPEFLERIIRTRRESAPETKTPDAGPRSAPTTRESAYARHALNGCVEELENADKGGRNNLLNTVAYRMGRLIGAGWIDRGAVIRSLGEAAKVCGLADEDGLEPVFLTIKSGLEAGIKKPHDPLGQKVKKARAASSGEITLNWPGSTDWSEMKWLVDDLIPENAFGMIVGESGAGKTFVALHLAASLAVGKPFFGKKITSPGGTAYVCAEGEFSIQQRLAADFSGNINPYLKADEADHKKMRLADLPIAILGNIPNLADPDALDKLIGMIDFATYHMKEKCGMPLRLVIVDTMLAGIGIEDLNNAARAQDAMNVLKKISQVTGAVAIGVHHHGKDSSRGPAGSYAFTAAADFILSVHRDANTGGNVKRRWVATTKSRAGETGWSCDFGLTRELVDVKEDGEETFCAFVQPLLEKASIEGGDDGKAAPENKASSALKKALGDALKTNNVVECDDGKFRGISKSLLRRGFDQHYGSESVEANRKAFARALKTAVQESAVVIKLKDRKEWVCLPTPVEETKAKKAD